MVRTKEELLDIESKRINGKKDYSLSESKEEIQNILGL